MKKILILNKKKKNTLISRTLHIPVRIYFKLTNHDVQDPPWVGRRRPQAPSHSRQMGFRTIFRTPITETIACANLYTRYQSTKFWRWIAYKYSFYLRTIRQWNRLPSDITAAPSLEGFKTDWTDYQQATLLFTNYQHQDFCFYRLFLF